MIRTSDGIFDDNVKAVKSYTKSYVEKLQEFKDDTKISSEQCYALDEVLRTHDSAVAELLSLIEKLKTTDSSFYGCYVEGDEEAEIERGTLESWGVNFSETKSGKLISLSTKNY